MRDGWKLVWLAAVAIALIAVFMTIDGSGNWDYVLPRRAKKIAGMLLTGCAISMSTVIFQTLTNNRILTPSFIGFDFLFVLLQTTIVFVFGAASLATMDANLKFLLAVAAMALFAGLLYRLLFRRRDQALFFLLLVGIICGTFFSSLSQFMQKLLDPNEFAVLQDRMFASFNQMNGEVLLMAALISAMAIMAFARDFKYLDVLALGRDHAINLGVPHERITKRFLILIAVLVAASTALVGPITFLGLLVSNVAYKLMRSFRHAVVIPAAALVSVVALVSGQLIVERVFTFSTTLSVILNFVGGVYFLYLLLKENKT